MRARVVRTSRAWRYAASGFAALAVAAVSAPARADDSQQFELAKGLFYGGQYDDVVRRLTILLDTSNPACASVEGAPTSPQTCHLADSVLVERSHEMLAVALVALKRTADADAVIEKMLRQNPAYSPEPGQLPPAVVERVREIRGRLQKDLEDRARKSADEQRKALLLSQKASEEERKWLAEMTALASKETVVERRSRVVAFVPFGVGQLQNGDTGLAILFAATQALAGGTAIGLAALHQYKWSYLDAPDPSVGPPVDKKELSAQMETIAIGNQIALGTWAALTIAGIVQANVAFVPEVRTTRDRPVPKRPTLPVVPTVTVGPNGASVGVVGVF